MYILTKIIYIFYSLNELIRLSVIEWLFDTKLDIVPLGVAGSRMAPKIETSEGNGERGSNDPSEVC